MFIMFFHSTARYNMIENIDRDTFKHSNGDNRWNEVFLDYNNLTTIEAKTFGHFSHFMETL